MIRTFADITEDQIVELTSADLDLVSGAGLFEQSFAVEHAK